MPICNSRLAYAFLAGAVVTVSNIASASGRVPCHDFHFPVYGFQSLSRDFTRALLLIRSGGESGDKGVGFLIDVKNRYYLTARHVIAGSIADPNRPIDGLDMNRRDLHLSLIDSDERLDVALLQAEPTAPLGDVQPFDIYLDTIGSDGKVTFPGLAFANEMDVTATTPSADTFSYDDAVVNMLLRVNTNSGDSGAPVYNDQGLVVGMVTKKQVVSQATAVLMMRLSAFIAKNAVANPASPFYNFLMTNHDVTELVRRLEPLRVPERVSNFQLLETINLVIGSNALSRLSSNIVYCPLIPATRHRGLEDAAEQLEISEADIVAATPHDDSPKTPPAFKGSSAPGANAPTSSGATDAAPSASPKSNKLTPPSSNVVPPEARHAAAVGQTLLKRANYWSGEGDEVFFRRLSKDARFSFAQAIASTLKTEQGRKLLLVFADKDDSPQQFQVKTTQVMARLGIAADISPEAVLAEFPSLSYETPKDDEFAAILNGYYRATAGALGLHTDSSLTEAKGITTFSFDQLGESKISALTAATGWAALTARSPNTASLSYWALTDALLATNQPSKAARTLAVVHRLSPSDPQILESYAGVRERMGFTPVAGETQTKEIARERPLSRSDLLDVTLGP